MRRVVFSVTELEPFFAKGGSVYSVDTETVDLHDLTLEGMSFCDGQDTYFVDLLNNPNREVLIEYLQKQFMKIKVLISHNIVFEMKVFKAHDIPYEHCELFCTKVADHLLNADRHHGLKDIMAADYGYTTVDWKEAVAAGKKSKTYYDYALNDAEWAWELANHQKFRLVEEGFQDLFKKIEMPFQHVLVEIELNGVKVDLKQLEMTKAEIATKIVALEKEMLDYLNEDYELQCDLMGNAKILSKINFNSSQQLSDILFVRLKLEPVDFTESGKPSVGADTILKLRGHPFINILEKYKIAQKLLSGFYEPIPEYIKEDGRIYPQYNDTGTVTGRLSCSKPNLQQLPKVNKILPFDTRKCFIVEPDYSMITCDYSGQELRVLAEISRDENLMQIFHDNKDLHLVTANEFYNLGINERYLFADHPDAEMFKKKYKKERDDAKIINFSISYGKGAFGFSKDFNITEEEAQKILDKYFATFPGVKTAMEETNRQVEANGFVTTAFGRRRSFQKITRDDWTGYGRKSLREAFNFLIQGYSADMIRLAAIACYKLKKDNPSWDLKIIGTVHDEILLEVKTEHEYEAAKAIRLAFINAVKLVIPVEAEVSRGRNYSECK
jgi:DNA polymerase-1